MKILFWILIPIILVTYSVILYKILGKKKDARKLLWAFGLIAFVGFVLHMVLFCSLTQGYYPEFSDLNARLLFSLQYTLEMFIGNPIILKVLEDIKEHTFLFYLYIPVYSMAVITSCLATFHFISRWLYTCSWICKHKAKAKVGTTHIFIGCNTASKALAEDIKSPNNKYQNDKILFVDLPDKGEQFQGLSVLDVIAQLFKERNEDNGLDKYDILRFRGGINRILEGLELWFQHKENIVYILSDSQDLNLEILESLWEFKSQNPDKIQCTIVCHAKREGLIDKYDGIADTGNAIKFVDSSYLSVEQIKKDRPMLLPVNFVNIATDFAGQRLGYVTTPFKCAVIGLGETGVEMLKFLYEFGAFPNELLGKSTFKCHIFEQNISSALAKSNINLLGLRSSSVIDDEEEFEFHNVQVETYEFRQEIDLLISELNYIVLTLGDENLNLKIAIDLVERAVMSGRDITDKFCVLIRMSEISKLNECTLAEARKVFGDCIYTFGTKKDVWKTDVIGNEYMHEKAKAFFTSYKALSEEIHKSNKWTLPDWDERLNKMRNGTYKERCSAQRKINQDFANCLHVTTKRELCKLPPTIPNNDWCLCAYYKELGESIYGVNDAAKHCGPDNEKLLQYLAICEHLRWEASHLMLGYRPTTGDTIEERKLHKNIKRYQYLDENTKHFDWLVVKNSLIN